MAEFGQTLKIVRAASPDFVILGGDEVQTHCLVCPPCSVDGEHSGHRSARSGLEARLRYRTFRRMYAPLTHSVPVYMVLGNHDGEAGFGTRWGRYQHFDDLLALSRPERLAHLPNPASVYSGSPDGNYYAFSWGDALFVVLDVMRYTEVFPERSEDWTLGAEQMAWLSRTLAEDVHTWKFVIAHHLVGGDPDLNLGYHYGRGGIRATKGHDPRAPFLGEQKELHRLMQRHGVQVFLHGHDHVFAAGEKPNADGSPSGVLYVMAPQPGIGTPSPWLEDPRFRRAFDYDEDGEPDFIARPGFVEVTVHGPRALHLALHASSTAAGEPGDHVLWDQWIVHPGLKGSGPPAHR